MSKRTSQLFSQATLLITGALIFLVVTSVARGQSSPDQRDEGFADHQVLYEAPAAPATSTTSPLTIDIKEDQTNLSVETPTLISPYLGAVNKQPGASEDISPRLDSKSDNLFDNYHLETGVGLSVDEQAQINLGYRFNDKPSLLDHQSGKTSDQDSGEIRFSLEIKLPF